MWLIVVACAMLAVAETVRQFLLEEFQQAQTADEVPHARRNKMMWIALRWVVNAMWAGSLAYLCWTVFDYKVPQLYEVIEVTK